MTKESSNGEATILAPGGPGPTLPAPRATVSDSSRGGEGPAEWRPGDRILDSYEVLGTLGEGGMGVVLRVLHLGWGVELAVKSPLPSLFGSEEDRASFAREAETWVGLGLHPNIATCHYVRTIGGIPRIFVELVDGGSLADWIRGGRLYEGGERASLERILDIAIQSAWGLAHAHARGLVHQDVKPANILMTKEGAARVTDFGLAAAGSSVAYRGMTPAYCSPEQAAGGRLTPMTDLWSWAVSVLEMFTGEASWSSGQVARYALDAYILEGPRDGRRPAMPEAVAALLSRCLETEAGDRPAGMDEAARLMRRAYEGAIGVGHPRLEPDAAGLRADTLNNRALSMLDLGHPEEAAADWDAALAIDPNHIDSIYNRGLVLWRAGKLADDAFLGRLRGAASSRGESGTASRLVGQVELERGDCAAAERELLAAAAADPREGRGAALAAARARLPRTRGQIGSLPGLGDEIFSLELSPDGGTALTGGGQSVFRQWNVEGRRASAALEEQGGTIRALGISADGALAAFGGEGLKVVLWHVASGRPARELEGCDSTPLALAVGPGAQTVLAGCRDGTLRLWRPREGQSCAVLEGHAGPVTSVDIGADGRAAVSGGRDGAALLWDLEQGRITRRLEGHGRDVEAVRFSTRGGFVASGSLDSTIKLWDPASGACTNTFAGHEGGVVALRVSPDGGRLLSGGTDGTLRLWETGSGRCLFTFEAHLAEIHAIALDAGGLVALSSGRDERLILWRVGSGDEPVPAPFELSRIESGEKALDAERRYRAAIGAAKAALGAGDGPSALRQAEIARSLPGFRRGAEAVELWGDLARRFAKKAFAECWPIAALEGHELPLAACWLSRDASRAATGGRDKSIRVWDAKGGRCLRALAGHTGAVNAICASPDERTIYSGGWDRAIRAWDPDSGACTGTFPPEPGIIQALCAADGGRIILSAGSDLRIRAWDAAGRSLLRTISGCGDRINALCDCSGPAGPRFLSAGSVLGRRNVFALWDAGSGDCLRVFAGHSGDVTALSADAGRGLVLSGSKDRSLRLWDIESGECLRVFAGHDEAIGAVALGADGRLAASGSRDGAIRLWDAGDGSCLAALPGHSGEVAALRLDEAGSHALSAGADSAARLWFVDWALSTRGRSGGSHE